MTKQNLSLEEFLADREYRYKGLIRDWGSNTGLGREAREYLMVIEVCRELVEQRNSWIKEYAREVEPRENFSTFVTSQIGSENRTLLRVINRSVQE